MAADLTDGLIVRQAIDAGDYTVFDAAGDVDAEEHWALTMARDDRMRMGVAVIRHGSYSTFAE